MNFPSSVIVTDQEIDLSNVSAKQAEYFFDLKNQITEIYEKCRKDRAIITFTGVSGVGKSVTVAILKALFDQGNHDFVTECSGIDAFTYTNEYLAEHNLHNVKGRFDTYDTDELNKVLLRFIHGHKVSFPRYSRKIHAPVQDGFVVSAQRALLLFEGLWLLRDENDWGYFRNYFTHNFLISGNEDSTRENTISRHVQGGRSEEDAQAFYESSDHKNTLEVLKNSVEPDETILYYENI